MNARAKHLIPFVLLIAVAVVTLWTRSALALGSDKFVPIGRTLENRVATQAFERPDKSGLIRNSSRFVTKQVSVSLGFDLRVDGFSFVNWGNARGMGSFDESSMVDVFGAYQVCRGASPVDCELTDAARATMKELDQGLSSGHCEGMVVAAGLNFLSRIDGGPTLVSGTRLQSEHEIAKWWATQFDSEVRMASAESRSASMSELADMIFASLADRKVVTMGVYDGDFAHSVLPISATWMGSVLAVGVYDPNVPGEERFIWIDTESDSWSYETYVHRVGVLEEVSGVGTGGLDLVPIELRSLPISASVG